MQYIMYCAYTVSVDPVKPAAGTDTEAKAETESEAEIGTEGAVFVSMVRVLSMVEVPELRKRLKLCRRYGGLSRLCCEVPYRRPCLGPFSNRGWCGGRGTIICLCPECSNVQSIC